MKLYMHPVSMTSRPVRLLIAEKGLAVAEQVVDLMKGEHYQPPYVALNPNKMVPMLEDGDLRLTESSAILKYLASKHDLPEYPKELKARARVDERMDWFNTQFYRDFGYGLAYPQIFPHHKRPTDDLQAGTLAWGKERAAGWFQILDQHWLGDNKYVTGDVITIADYFGVGLVSLGEIIKCDFGALPNVNRWLTTMKSELKSWNQVNEVFYGFANAVKDQKFEAV